MDPADLKERMCLGWMLMARNQLQGGLEVSTVTSQMTWGSGKVKCKHNKAGCQGLGTRSKEVTA